MSELKMKARVYDCDYNLNEILVSVNMDAQEIVIIMPLYGALIMRVNMIDCRNFIETSPKSDDMNEWKEFFLNDESHVNFMHYRMIEELTNRELLLKHSLIGEKEKLVQKYKERIGVE